MRCFKLGGNLSVVVVIFEMFKINVTQMYHKIYWLGKVAFQLSIALFGGSATLDPPYIFL